MYRVTIITLAMAAFLAAIAICDFYDVLLPFLRFLGRNCFALFILEM